MATLEEALYGLNFTPAENPYGIAATQLGQITPKLINPYGSTGEAVGISLGSILLQSLLGYQARSQAAQETLQLNTLANQMQELTSAQARTDFITGVEDPMYQSRLSTLATALNAQERARKADLAKLRGVADLDVEKQRAIDAGVPLSELPALDKLRTERRKQLFGLPVGESSTIEAPTAGSTFQTGSADALLTSPEMQQVLTKADKEALAARAKLTAAQREESDKLRKEFSSLPEVKNYSLVDTAARVVAKAVQDPSAVATQELVRRAVQMIEPGMAVREGEQAAIMKSQSIPDQFKGELERALAGQGGLQQEVRDGIMRIAQRAYTTHAERYNTTLGFYEGLAKDRSVPMKSISYLGAAEPWEAISKGAVQNKESQLSDIYNKMQQTSDPARIAELKRQAAQIMSSK